MLYRNKRTGAVIETPCRVSGGGLGARQGRKGGQTQGCRQGETGGC